MHIRMFLVTCFVVVASGCLGSDDSGPSAEEMCEALIDTRCRRVAECGEGITSEGPPPDFQQECEDASASELHCVRAVSVGQSYDDCIDTLDDYSCRLLISVDPYGEIVGMNDPASCEGVILKN